MEPDTGKVETEEGAGGRSPVDRVVDFVRRRPLTSLGLLAVGGALGGAEWCVGALVGGAAAALVARKTGPELRRSLREGTRRSYERLLHRHPAAKEEEPSPETRH